MELGLWSDANAGNYASLDNVELFHTDIGASSAGSSSARVAASQATSQQATQSHAAGLVDASISVYPNPSASESPVHVALGGLAGRSVVVRITDLLGRLVAQQSPPTRTALMCLC